MNHMPGTTLPSAFCWTRFGTEAGERIEAIIERKERERRANNGVFFWGIGNSVAPALTALVGRCELPQVLFSPMRSRPRAVDVHPASVVAWQAGETLAGDAFILPASARITSRGSAARTRAHYALVCHSPTELALVNLGRLELGELRNLLSGNRVGASQVTAVVKQVSVSVGGPAYEVALRATLVAPYFVRLRHPQAAHDLAA